VRPRRLAVNSATSAMRVGLATLGIGAGDEVITTPMTFCSTVHVIEHSGARPSWWIAAGHVDDRSGAGRAGSDGAHQGAAARAPVRPSLRHGRLLDIAQRHHLHIVEDAAHALPARYKGRLIGSAPLACAAGEAAEGVG